MKFWTGKTIKELQPSQVFVFGSNPEGRHGLGAAKSAMKFGARYGKGRGLQGQTYALPTKNLKAGFYERVSGITYPKAGKCSISLEQIRVNIAELYVCAKEHPDKQFIVVYQKNSNNLNGYSPNDIIKQFLSLEVPTNMYFHESFR
tara:strand:+ start:518 stop:955 length:438 start_codon:yes stop_codon:yes gene_type:complete